MNDIQNKSFEELVQSAREIIEHLGQSDVNLKEALELYKKGVATLQQAQEMLESAKLEFEEIQRQSYDDTTQRQEQ